MDDFDLDILHFVTQPCGSAFTYVTLEFDPIRFSDNLPRHITSQMMQAKLAEKLKPLGLDEETVDVQCMPIGYKTMMCKLLVPTDYVSALAMLLARKTEQ